MTTIKISNRCTITGLSSNLAAQIKTALTLRNPAFVDAVKQGRYIKNINEHLHYFRTTDAGLVVPRGFTGGVVDIIGPFTLIDKRRTLEPLQLEFSGDLRGYQASAVEDLNRFDFAVAEAATGSGKTIIALALVAKRQQPTLVLVHSSELLFQWRDRIRQFLGVEPGLVGAGEFDIQDITIGIINSVEKRIDELKEKFSFIVVDECHRAAGSMFKKVISSFDSKYMLGLSATPDRRDKLSQVVNFYLGRTVHKVDKTHLNEIGAVLRPEIVQVETDFRYDYQDDYSTMISTLVEDPGRNMQIVQETVKRTGMGVILIVSDRTAQLESIGALLRDAGLESVILTGGVPKKRRLQIVADIQSGNVKILLSTTSLISEGYDEAGLCVLILSTPISFSGRLIQVVGRCLRPGPDKTPVVVDMNDCEVGVLRNGAKKRLRILKNL